MDIIVKQIPDAAAEQNGLAKYNMSKIPGTKQATQAGEGRDGRWITGIDENAYSLTKIEDLEEREKIRAEKLELRKKLEAALGVNLDASPTNPYWDGYLVDITAMGHVDMENPKERLALEVALANGVIAPSLEASSQPGYHSCKFYLYTEESATAVSMTRVELKDTAKYELVKLRKSGKRLVLVGRHLLPLKINPNLQPDTIYLILSNWIEEDSKNTKVTNAEKFIKVAQMKNEDLYTKLIVDEAVGKSIIKFREGRYQRGNVTYGRNPIELLSFFSQPENEKELISIKLELEQDFAFRL